MTQVMLIIIKKWQSLHPCRSNHKGIITRGYVVPHVYSFLSNKYSLQTNTERQYKNKLGNPSTCNDV